MFNFSIVIPIFNEEKNIGNLLDEIFKIDESKYNFEVIVVDDFSSDNSNKQLKIFLNKKNFILIKNKSNKGQSFSLNIGYENARSETIVTLDGDGQNDPKDIPKLVDIYFSSDVKLVSGIRVKRNDSFTKIISSKIANFIRDLFLKDGCPDTGCGLKVMNRKILKEFKYFNGIHRFYPSLFVGHGYKCSYHPVNHRKRTFGKSKYNNLDRAIRGIRDLFKVYKYINKIKYD